MCCGSLGGWRGQEQAPHCAPAAQGEPESHAEDATGSGAVAWGGGIRVIHIAVDPKVSYCWSLAVAAQGLHRGCPLLWERRTHTAWEFRWSWLDTCGLSHCRNPCLPFPTCPPVTFPALLGVGCHAGAHDRGTAAVTRIIVSPPRDERPACHCTHLHGPKQGSVHENPSCL